MSLHVNSHHGLHQTLVGGRLCEGKDLPDFTPDLAWRSCSLTTRARHDNLYVGVIVHALGNCRYEELTWLERTTEHHIKPDLVMVIDFLHLLVLTVLLCVVRRLGVQHQRFEVGTHFSSIDCNGIRVVLTWEEGEARCKGSLCWQLFFC